MTKKLASGRKDKEPCRELLVKARLGELVQSGTERLR